MNAPGYSYGRTLILLLVRLMVFTESVQAEVPLRVAYAGFAHSVTHSLSAALKRLGFQPCHGEEIWWNGAGSHAALLNALISHNIESILRETSQVSCNAAMDMHAPFWHEIMDASPDTKLIFMVSEFESWYESIKEMLRLYAPVFRYPLRFLPQFELSYQYMLQVGLSRQGGDQPATLEEARSLLLHPETPEHKTFLKQAHEKFVSEAHEITREQPERALLFDLKDGYPPLCRFLKIEDCPRDHIPHLRQGGFMLLRVIEIFLYCLPVIALLMGWKLAAREKSSRQKTKQH